MSKLPFFSGGSKAPPASLPPPPSIDSQEPKEFSATKGVKIKNKHAEQAELLKKEKEEYKKRFDDQASKTIEYHNEKQKVAVEVLTRFIKAAHDKTLLKNKGSIGVDIDTEIRKDVINLANDLNNDDTEQLNCSGSMAAITAIMKILFDYRDRINELEYKISNMKKLEAQHNSIPKVENE